MLLLLGLLSPPVRAGSAILDCTADTWINTREPEQTHARDTELHLWGKAEIALMNFRFAAVRDWKVEQATLLLHVDEIRQLSSIGVVAVPVKWNEVEANAVEGAAGSRWVPKGKLPDLLGKFDSERTNYRPVREGELGWIEVDLPTKLIEDCIADRSYGFAVFVRLRDGEWLIHSREMVRYAPMLKIQGGPKLP